MVASRFLVFLYLFLSFAFADDTTSSSHVIKNEYYTIDNATIIGGEHMGIKITAQELDQSSKL